MYQWITAISCLLKAIFAMVDFLSRIVGKVFFLKIFSFIRYTKNISIIQIITKNIDITKQDNNILDSYYILILWIKEMWN